MTRDKIIASIIEGIKSADATPEYVIANTNNERYFTVTERNIVDVIEKTLEALRQESK